MKFHIDIYIFSKFCIFLWDLLNTLCCNVLRFPNLSFLRNACFRNILLLAAELQLKPEFPGKVLKFLTSLDVKFHLGTSYMGLKFLYRYIYILYIMGYVLISGLVAKLMVKQRPRKSFSGKAVQILDYSF